MESEFPHFVASRNESQSLPLSAVKIAGSGERAYSSSRSKGTRGELKLAIELVSASRFIAHQNPIALALPIEAAQMTRVKL